MPAALNSSVDLALAWVRGAGRIGLFDGLPVKWRSDLRVAAAAVERDVRNYSLAPTSLKDSSVELALLALSKDSNLYGSMSEAVKGDPRVAAAAVKASFENYKSLPAALTDSVDLARIVVDKFPTPNFLNVPLSLRSNDSIAIAFLMRYPKSYSSFPVVVKASLRVAEYARSQGLVG